VDEEAEPVSVLVQQFLAAGLQFQQPGDLAAGEGWPGGAVCGCRVVGGVQQVRDCLGGEGAYLGCGGFQAHSVESRLSVLFAFALYRIDALHMAFPPGRAESGNEEWRLPDR
jgi:hypothetical protein